MTLGSSAGTTDPAPGPARQGRSRWRPTIRTAFFGVLLVVLAGYTHMAYQMDWITSGGRIGPGFFPRIIGTLSVLICLGALVNSLRPDVGDEEELLEDEAGEADYGRHPLTLTAVVAGTAVLWFTLTTLGAIVASALFMLGMLAYLNPRRWVTNVALSVLVPLALYLLFQTALNAGLPAGILPRF